MVANEQNKDQNTWDASSQAGLASFPGGQAKALPSAPEPGRPGSRFSPRVVSREEQAVRRSVRGTPLKTVPRKSLDIGAPALIQGVPQGILDPSKQGQDLDGKGATEAAAKGFAAGAAAVVQGRVLDAAETGAEAALDVAFDGPLPGLAEPLIADTLESVRDKTRAGSGRSKVVMAPGHVASLAALDPQPEEGPAGPERGYGR